MQSTGLTPGLPHRLHAPSPRTRPDLVVLAQLDCILTGAAPTACLAAGECLAAANFAPQQTLCVFTRRRPELVAAYVGASVEVEAGKLDVRILVPGRGARLLASPSMLRVEGDVRLDAAPDGRIYAANCGTQPAHVQIATGKESGKRQSLAPGEIRLL